ncbi:MAG: nucleotidyltransferase [bacterium]|nr:nucleotidyltransferase [bacterium]
MQAITIDRVALERAVEVKIFGKKWRVARPEELILYKLGRRKLTRFDEQDIKELIEAQSDNLDWKRMECLADTLRNEYASDFKERFKKLKKLR